MNQAEIDKAVAHATGETRSTISRMGFVLLTTRPVEREDNRAPLVVDWDELERVRHSQPALA